MVLFGKFTNKIHNFYKRNIILNCIALWCSGQSFRGLSTTDFGLRKKSVDGGSNPPRAIFTYPNI